MKRFRVGIDASELDDADHVPVQIVETQRDDLLLTFPGIIEGGLQIRHELREDRDDSLFVSFVLLGLRTLDGHARLRPVDGIPCQTMRLGRNPQTGISRQSEEETPLHRWTFLHDPVRFLGGDVARAARGDDSRRKIGERVRIEDMAADGISHHLLRHRRETLHGRLAQSAFDERETPVLGIASGDSAERLLTIEESEQRVPRLFQFHNRRRFEVRPAVDVAAREVCQPDRFSRLDETDAGETVMQNVGKFPEPLRGLRVQRVAGDAGGDELLDLELDAFGVALGDLAEPDGLPAPVFWADEENAAESVVISD